MFKSGQKFDSSRDEFREPLDFKVGVGMVIPGFDKGVLSMSVGEKAIVEITSDDAYGQRGAPPVIPPNSDLVFELELLAIH
jgi:FK506-binding protein 1